MIFTYILLSVTNAKAKEEILTMHCMRSKNQLMKYCFRCFIIILIII